MELWASLWILMGFLVFLNDSFPQVLLKKISKVSTPNLQIIPPVREPLGRPYRNATSSTPSPKIATPKVPLHVLPRLLPKQSLPAAVNKFKAKNFEPIAAASGDAPSYGAAAVSSSTPDPAPDYLPPNKNASDAAIDSESATPPPAYLPPKKEDKSAMKTTMETTAASKTMETTTAVSKTMDDVVTYPMSTKETTASTAMTTTKSSTEADTSSSPVTYPQDTVTSTSTTTSTSPMTKAAPATTTSTTTTTEATDEEPVTDSMQADEPLEQPFQEALPEGYLPPVPSANPMSLPSDNKQDEPKNSDSSDNIDSSNYLPPNPSPQAEDLPRQSSTSAPFYLPPETEGADSAAMKQRGPSAFSAEPSPDGSHIYEIYSYSHGPQPVPYFMPPVAREIPQQSNFNGFYSLRNGRSLRPATAQQATAVRSENVRNGMNERRSSFGNSLRPKIFSGYQYSIQRNDGSAHVYVYHG